MRVALLTGEYPPQPGGVGDYTRHLAEALVARGHGVLVYTIVDCRLQIVDLGRSTIHRQSTSGDLRSNWGWRSWRAVIAALAQTRPDVLHIQYQTGAYGMRPAINLLPWRLKRLPARPAVAVTAHDLLLPYLFPKAGPLRDWVTWRLLRDADALVVTNEADFAQVAEIRHMESGAADLRTRTGQPGPRPQAPSLIPIGSNIDVAPQEGYDRAAWRARLGVAAGETLVAYFGLISRTKGLDVLLGALARLPATFRLLIVGGAATAPEDRAYAAEIERRAAALGLGPRLITTGHCPAPEVSAHLLAADLAALPFADGASFRRGSLLAALAHGLPTVTTPPAEGQSPKTKDQGQAAGFVDPRSLAPRPVVDGESALLVAPGDEQALAGAIERLAGDAALRARLASGGRAVAAQFSWDEIAARHEELYERLSQRATAARGSSSLSL
ncbi:MAG: glycosyltransferase family 4 protein [Kouleothrix sp.]|nr:glycosyltransferase family 4 protein [Kouleothrix sp.]